MELNVMNMPLNTIYRFDINKYVWSTILNETRGNKKLDQPTKLTEVYEITNEGYLHLAASGELVNNGNPDDYSRGFAIKDYDKNETIDFKVTMHLSEVEIKELNELREAIAMNYNKNKRH